MLVMKWVLIVLLACEQEIVEQMDALCKQQSVVTVVDVLMILPFWTWETMVTWGTVVYCGGILAGNVMMVMMGPSVT